MKHFTFTKKILLTILICVITLQVPVNAYEIPDTETTAEQLAKIGVFIGSDKGFELERQPTRIEGLIMLIRLLGAEDDAFNQEASPSVFTDVPEWAVPYTNYAYSVGLTKGIGNNQFGSLDPLPIEAYATFVLRALGYDDTNGDFTYTEAATVLDDMLNLTFDTESFTRGDVADISYESLYLLKKDTETTLLSSLVLSKDIPLYLYPDFSQVPFEYTSDEQVIYNSYNNSESLILSTKDNQLTINATYPTPNQWAIIVYGSNETNVKFDGNNLTKTVALEASENDSINFEIYLNSQRYGNYSSWIYGYEIFKHDDNYGFTANPVLERNQTYYNYYNFIEEDYLLTENQIYPENEDIIDLSNTIVGDITNDYEKLYAIHSWVSTNIFYDYDNPGVTNLDNYDHSLNDALTVLITKKGICEGYSNLTVSLLRAQGIYARKVAGNINNVTSTYYFDDGSLDTTSNHSWYEAYIDDEWIICDPTFDSANEYKNGTYYTNDSTTTYFDIELDAFSNDHQILDYYDNQTFDYYDYIEFE